MWNWKPAKEMLEALYSCGELAIAARVAFQRLYDLPERVIPRKHLDAPCRPRRSSGAASRSAPSVPAER